MAKFRPPLWILITLASAALLGCSAPSDDPAYDKAEALPDYQQGSFSEYVGATRAWLKQHRLFLTHNPEQELTDVLPREYQPSTPNGQGVLLVHGLGDTPYSFVDVATHLADQGYLVRTLLLPGHASKVGDLQLAQLSDWQKVVDHHINLLKHDTDSIWVGGYSTGANLVTAAAWADQEINGILLFSPAFEPGSGKVRFAELASYFVTWADQDPEDNPLRYNSLPMNAGAVYYQTSVKVRQTLNTAHYNKPVFMLMSEADRVIDTQYAIETFSEKMLNPHSQLVWQGERDLNESRSTRFSMTLPQQRITNGSHMGLLFSPRNPNYGIHGSNRICSNGQGPENEVQCQQGKEVWYSSWGYTEPNKVYARLTYNPYFDQTMRILDSVMAAPH
ncbi:alpha/beta hydrolase [Vibrio ostreicida]|uniref:alpha/beta hydrolase n=1 Tax=Vibrio ostreicida TaxID=526588 RepID=UPI003B5C9D67